MEVEEIERHQGGGALQTAKDLFAGAVGGVAQVLIGMRFPVLLVFFFFSSFSSSLIRSSGTGDGPERFVAARIYPPENDVDIKVVAQLINRLPRPAL